MNQQELTVFLFLTKKYPKLKVIDFNKQPLFFYKKVIQDYKGVGFIGLFPPFLFEGRTCYNDFSLYLPSGKLIAIECKQRKGFVDLTYIQEKMFKTKSIVEDKIIYLFDGQGFTKKTETIEEYKHTKSDVIYTLSDFLKVA